MAAHCRAEQTLAQLSTSPQPPLSWLSRWIALLTTPFKLLGISGWHDTGCVARASGAPVRDAQHSTDGFWTIDVRLEWLDLGGLTWPTSSENGKAPRSARFLRIEVEPETKAHAVCASREIRAGEPLRFGGPVVLDTDGAGSLEVHPDGDFAVEQRS